MDQESTRLRETGQSVTDKHRMISLSVESHEQNKLGNKRETESQVQRTD